MQRTVFVFGGSLAFWTHNVHMTVMRVDVRRMTLNFAGWCFYTIYSSTFLHLVSDFVWMCRVLENARSRKKSCCARVIMYIYITLRVFTHILYLLIECNGLQDHDHQVRLMFALRFCWSVPQSLAIPQWALLTEKNNVTWKFDLNSRDEYNYVTGGAAKKTGGVEQKHVLFSSLTLWIPSAFHIGVGITPGLSLAKAATDHSGRKAGVGVVIESRTFCR